MRLTLARAYENVIVAVTAQAVAAIDAAVKSSADGPVGAKTRKFRANWPS